MSYKLTVYQRDYCITRIKEEGKSLGVDDYFINTLCDMVVLIPTLDLTEFERILDSLRCRAEHLDT